MPERTVVVFGAGATKACGGPLTNEILPHAFEHANQLDREQFLGRLEHFLIENFNLPASQAERKPEHYPNLPLLLSLIDKAIDQRQPFTPSWQVSDLQYVRDALEYTVFALLELELRTLTSNNPYQTLLSKLPMSGAQAATVISLNYDLIADNSMATLSNAIPNAGLPDYGCDISTQLYKSREHFGRLLKLHGSLNWIYCPNCRRLDIGVSQSGRSTSKVLEELYGSVRLEEKYSCKAVACVQCTAPVRPVLITPTQLKDYRNPHISRVWYEAGRALRDAQAAIFVGYSLPDDDLDVAYLLKRGLSHLKSNKITVVEWTAPGEPTELDQHPVGKRYRTLFGPELEWRPMGFANWVTTWPGPA